MDDESSCAASLVRRLEQLAQSARKPMSDMIEEAGSRNESSKAIGGMVIGVFKRCTLCGKVWTRRADFLSDPELHLNGYQGSLRRLLTGKQRRGLLLFTHKTEGCGTTLAFDPSDFKDERHEKVPDNTIQEDQP
jgi:hypothetical protein